MRIAVIDPSLFSLPYDDHLCAALGRRGHHVELFGRTLRTGESAQGGRYTLTPWFYRMSERWLRRRPHSRAARWCKAVEHQRDMARLAGYLRRQAVQAIHFQWTPLPLTDRWWLRRLATIAPVLLTVHDTNPLRGSASSALQFIGQRAVLRAADRLIVHTRFSRSVLIDQHLPADRIHVIAHGILGDVPEEPPSCPADSPVREILLFGAIKPYKGVDLLIEAFARLPADLQRSARLAIRGQPAMDCQPLRALAERLGVADRIDWDLRFIPEDRIDELCSRALLRVFPYRDIDASGALMQALRFGRPIIATDVGAFSEVITDQRDGLLVRPGDADALAKAMAKLLGNDNLAARLGRAAWQRCRTIDSWDHIAELTEQVYQGR